MKKDELFYITALLLHVGMGFLFFFFPFIGSVYSVLVVLVGIGYVVHTTNRNNEVLVMAAYCMGMDVYLKIIGASLLYEYGKYTVIIFMLLGIYYRGFSRGSFLYVIFVALLIPGIFIGAESLSLDTNIRKAISFNISGPACLAVSAVYCFNRPIALHRLQDALAFFLFPLMAMLVHLYLYAPSIQDVLTGTGSNFEASGGFGPNQVSTVLGLAMFIFFERLLLVSFTKKMQIINATLTFVFAYRCTITFSRGGMITGLAVIAVFLATLYFIIDLKAKAKLMFVTGLSFVAALLVWGYTSLQTGGLIDKRYANENARGVEKSSMLSGREDIMASEIQMFLDNPYLGVGVGKNKEVRLEETGIWIATHSEVTRLLAEHGSLGLLGFLILLITPIVLYLRDRTQIFALVFMVFWLLTINHAAMRIAAPGFVYGLALLRVKFFSSEEEDSSPRPSPKERELGKKDGNLKGLEV